MSIEDSEQDCTVYIEQLKSDNPSLKLNAASKITAIAAILGHNRMRDQLIPYLIEIIEQMDNDNEFLVRVAEQLIQLKPFCRDLSQSYILIPPLKILAALDQPVVREKAVQSLQKLAQNQSKLFFKKHYYPLIKQMASQEAYPSRVSVCGLIPICYPQLDAQFQSNLRGIFNKLALNEDIPMVRRCLAENIQAYSQVIAKNMMRTQVLQIWQKFIGDGIDIVRIKALQIVTIVAKFFKKQELPDKFVKFIKIVDLDKKSWRIRYALVQAWANLLDYLDKQTIRKDVLQSMQQLLKDPEHQVRSIAILKLPDLSRKLSPSQNSTTLLPHFQRLVKDTSLHVRQSVVQSIIAFLGNIEKDKVLTTGISLIELLLKDEAISVRIGLIQRMKYLLELLGTDNIKKFVIPILISCQQDKKWRFRLSVVENLSPLFKNLGYQSFKDSLQPLIKGFLKDHYFAVRQQTFLTFAKLKQSFGAQKSKELIISSLNQLSKDSNFVFRIASLQGLAKCSNALQKKQLNDLFSEFIKRFEGQKIANVLINLIKCYNSLKTNLTAQTKKQWIQLVKKLKQSKDEDVVYFATKSQQA